MGSRYRLRDLVDNPPDDLTAHDMRALGELHRALQPKKSRRKKKSAAYLVVAPLYIAGIYTSWAMCEAVVRGVSGAQFRGYPTVRAAEAEFAKIRELARQRGIRLPNLRRTT